MVLSYWRSWSILDTSNLQNWPMSFQQPQPIPQTLISCHLLEHSFARTQNPSLHIKGRSQNKVYNTLKPKFHRMWKDSCMTWPMQATLLEIESPETLHLWGPYRKLMEMLWTVFYIYGTKNPGIPIFGVLQIIDQSVSNVVNLDMLENIENIKCIFFMITVKSCRITITAVHSKEAVSQLLVSSRQIGI